MANSHVRYAFGPKWIALPRITIFAPAAVLSLDMTTLPCPMPSFAKSGKRRDAHFSSRKTIDHDLLRLFSMRSEEPYRSVARGCSLFSLLESSAYGHPCRSMALASIQLCSDGSLRGEIACRVASSEIYRRQRSGISSIAVPLSRSRRSCMVRISVTCYLWGRETRYAFA